MSTINSEVVQRKLDELLDYLNELKKFESLTIEEFLAERTKQFIVERVIELIVQTAIDINKYLLKRKGVNLNVLTSYKTFVELSKFGIITELLAEAIKQSIETRNALAHRYSEISPEEVFEEINDILGKYPDYVRQISQFIDSIDDE